MKEIVKTLHRRLSGIRQRVRTLIRSIRGRKFPVLPMSEIKPTRQISFVVVRFSYEYEHNIMVSLCVKDPINQLIMVDNTANVYYYSLSEAINVGLSQIQHEIVVIVHEDVYLPEGWHSRLEYALTALEKKDPQWGVLGTAGTTRNGILLGHYSDPHNYCNTFKEGEEFAPVDSVDEHLMIIRASSKLTMDALHPGIHGIGTDLVLTARQQGMQCYVVNAPSIHKYRNAKGKKIKTVNDSPKIMDRANFAYKADKRCCDEYISHKWNSITPFISLTTHYTKWQHPQEALEDIPADICAHMDSPLILLGKGGGGSRLLSLLMRDCGVCIGKHINRSGDCEDMVEAVYQGAIEKYKCKAGWQKEIIIPQLRLAAARMLQQLTLKERELWGFKLPELLLILPELSAAFPNARYVQMFRDPVKTCMRRTHMTARLDNQIGRVTLPLAYREAGLAVEQIFNDSPAFHMAYTTLHQMNLSLDLCQQLNPEQYHIVYFEELLTSPENNIASMAQWLGTDIIGHTLADSVDLKRATQPGTTYPDEITARVKEILAPLMLKPCCNKYFEQHK